MNSHNSLPGPDDILREELPNGIVVLARANFASPSVAISGYMPCGSILDPAEKTGLCGFLSACLMRGTASHDFFQIYNQIESSGASLNFNASTHSVLFSGRSLSEDLAMILELIAEVLKSPTFPETHIEQIRSQILASLSIRSQSTQDMAEVIFDRELFGAHPYGRDDAGTPDSIRSINQEDMLRFHSDYFGPKGMVICVVGGVEPAEAVQQVRNAFASWTKETVQFPSFDNLPMVQNPNKLKKVHLEIAEKSQMDLIIGGIGPERKSPFFQAAQVGNCILGQFGMMGRIGKIVRDDHGLAYYAGSNLNSSLLSGSWEVSAGVNPKNRKKASELIIAELKRFVDSPVSLEELEDVKSYYIGRLPLDMENNAGVVYYLLNMERYSLGLNYYRNYENLIRSVTAEDVLSTARKYLDPERLLIVSAGTKNG